MTTHTDWIWVALCAAWIGSAPAGASELRVDAPNTAEAGDEVTYSVEFSVIVTPPHHTNELTVWLPVPPTTDVQTVDDYQIEAYPIEVTPDFGTDATFGNTFAVLRYRSPEGAQIIKQSYRVTTRELQWAVDRVGAPTAITWPVAFDVYRRAESQLVLDERIRALAAEIVPHPSNIVTDMQRVIGWVLDNMSYDHSKCSLKASAAWAAERRCGHCSDYHGLSAALGRALGYATRVVYGIIPEPKNSPSHCKLEVFIPPHGWVSFDVSSTQKQIDGVRAAGDLAEEEKAVLAGRALDRLFAGFRDDTWIHLTTGTDYVLPGGPRVPLVRTAYVVADAVALPDPDPANPDQTEFAWMTAHRYTSSRPVSSPFASIDALWRWDPRMASAGSISR